MLKKGCLLVLILLLVHLISTSPGHAGPKEEKEARFAERVRESIAKLGTGPNARIEVTLQNNTKLKGYVSEASDNNFVVVDNKTGAATHVSYPQVKKVRGNNLSTGVKIAIGIGLAIYLFFVLRGIANGNG